MRIRLYESDHWIISEIPFFTSSHFSRCLKPIIFNSRKLISLSFSDCICSFDNRFTFATLWVWQGDAIRCTYFSNVFFSFKSFAHKTTESVCWCNLLGQHHSTLQVCLRVAECWPGHLVRKLWTVHQTRWHLLNSSWSCVLRILFLCYDSSSKTSNEWVNICA